MNRLIIIGGSAGGLDAMLSIVSKLDPTLSAAVLLVLHLGLAPAPQLPQKIEASAKLPTRFAKDNTSIKSGHIYIAPPDLHTFVAGGRFKTTYGPRVNRSRPSIDLAMRSAAVARGSQTVGVIVSGMLDDGALGLSAIDRCGGVTIVQDPEEAKYAEMPCSALELIEADYVEQTERIGCLLNELATQPIKRRGQVPMDIRLENEFDMKNRDQTGSIDKIGSPVPLGCPECGGPLWGVDSGKLAHYRCHIGHSLTAKALLSHQDDEIEHALWTALRTLEEKGRMQGKLADAEAESERITTATSIRNRADETLEQARQLRSVLNKIGRSRSLAHNAMSN